MENMDNKVNGRRQGDASDLHGSNGTIIDNSRNSRGIVHDHEDTTGIIVNDSLGNSKNYRTYQIVSYMAGIKTGCNSVCKRMQNLPN
jgi:hypothetical protein